ncbi:NAD(P)H-dependent flavin oxidoreductase [Pseudomonas mangiferae]|uniref:Nitronate monooxygenase n=1 Tax=Pseudomonas mangiferae TaxID=2593654 RepID=A0A553GZ59_9PSED|nr:nitronate monooxygenase [Pseudomonas mangiferae]TRX74791.1 nitronate monooxygenase [Pseudomonas mangiferae]
MIVDPLFTLGLRHPIVQAPMAGVSTPALAAAVCNAGALGSLGLGASSEEQARTAIRETRALTDRPFNVNLFCHRPATADAIRERDWLAHLAPFFAELGATPPATLAAAYRSFTEDEAWLEMLLEERPAVVSLHFGLPAATCIQALKAAGLQVWACVTTPDEAAQAEAAGVDLLVAQGIEAGGHRGVFDPARGDAGYGTLALVRLLARRGRLPVIAAGGIMDGQGIAAALDLGACAAQLGTAFVLCPESSADAAYRDALRQAGETRITAAISGRPARGLVNRFHDLERPGAPAWPDYPIAYDAAKALQRAAGNRGFGVHWAGQAAALARELPAAELVERLAAEWRNA